MKSRSNPEQAGGKEELRRLAQATVRALRDAELTDEIALLELRVFARPAGELFETDLDHDQCSVRFKPMLELLLLHIQDAATTGVRSAEQRREEIGWALDAAGY